MRGLRWGIKASFIRYVAGMPDGVMSVTDGAVDTPEGFLFPVRDSTQFDPRTGMGRIRFAGDVRFRAHGGALQLRIAEPELVADENGATLFVGAVGDTRLPVAALSAPRPAQGGGIEISATLTAEAVPYFNDVYAAGTALDPIVIRGV
ncbi:HtaA domain-containing protein [Microbacterium sp. NPDC055910]|uniref:HtaA domain-containing protein n=1 Tax=Microbacterium sp. NPDC055910 TaxID=3345659 RepID=UPI0035E15F87